jgi:hypothetical protein
MSRRSRRSEIAKLQNGRFLPKAERDALIEKNRPEKEQFKRQRKFKKIIGNNRRLGGCSY